jgi:hypothetical protein
MRTIIMAVLVASVASVPFAVSARADDTTVIRKDYDNGDHKTVIKKHDDRGYVAPREEKKVIIHHD